MDTQMGSVTSLTAGEQDWGAAQPGQGRDWSSGTWGSSGTLGHSAPLTIPQPLLHLARTLTMQDRPSQQTVSPAPLCSVHPGPASAYSLLLKPTKFSLAEICQSHPSLTSQTSDRGSSAIRGPLRNLVLARSSASSLGL